MVLIFASLVAWLAIGALFTALLKDDLSKTATNADQPNASDIAPASGPTTKKAK
jgi:hypothetical protein